MIKKRLKTLWNLEGIPFGIWILSFISLLQNISSVIIISFVPLFLRAHLGANMCFLGFVDALTESTASLTRILSGLLSDRIRKRKSLIFIGYLLCFIPRLILVVTKNIWVILSLRVLERFGNGIQASPREALTSDLAPPDKQGACFGLKQSLTIIGSFVGSIIGTLLALWIGRNFSLIFLIAAIPSFFSLLFLALFIQDPPTQHRESPAQPLSLFYFQNLPRGFWSILIVSLLFTLGNFGPSFHICALEQFGVSTFCFPLVMVVKNACNALFAFPAGKMSDMWSSRNVLIIGMSVLLVANLLLALSPHILITFFAIALWGIQLGITQSVLLSIVSQSCPLMFKATSFGLFYLASGIGTFIINILMGFAWDVWGSRTAFLISTLFVAIAIGAAFFLLEKNVSTSQ